MNSNPTILVSPKLEAAPDLEDPEVDAELAPVADADPERAVGVNVAVGFDMHELAAALAADTPDGVEGFTVPLPEKLQAMGLSF